MTTQTQTFQFTDSDGEDQEIELPVRFAVCGECDGHGTVLNPSIAQHVYTPEEFRASFTTEEERAAYFHRGGRYDVRCPTCRGLRVVHQINEDAAAAVEGYAEFVASRKRSERFRREQEAELRTQALMGGMEW